MGSSGVRAPRLYATRGHLACALGLMAVLVLGGGLWPLSPQSPVGLWFAASGLLAALAVGVQVLPARRWTMPGALAVALAGAGVLLASCRTAEGLVVLSIGVMTAAQYAAYAFRARVAAPLVAGAIVAVTAGMVLAPVPFHALTWLVVVIMTVASTSLLGHVTHWLRRHATTDDLTGALNRAAVLDRVEAAAAEAGPQVAARVRTERVDIATWDAGDGTYDLVTTHFLHLPPEVRTVAFARMARAVAPGGTLLVVAHHASDLRTTIGRPDLPELFFDPEEVVAALDPGAWDVPVAEARPRPATDPDGREITIRDTVVRAVRRR